MGKRTLVLLLSALLCMALVSCGGDSQQTAELSVQAEETNPQIEQAEALEDANYPDEPIMSLDAAASMIEAAYTDKNGAFGAEVSALSDGVVAYYWMNGMFESFMGYYLGENNDGKEAELIEKCNTLAEGGRELLNSMGYQDKQFLFSVVRKGDTSHNVFSVLDGEIIFNLLDMPNEE